MTTATATTLPLFERMAGDKLPDLLGVTESDVRSIRGLNRRAMTRPQLKIGDIQSLANLTAELNLLNSADVENYMAERITWNLRYQSLGWLVVAAAATAGICIASGVSTVWVVISAITVCLSICAVVVMLAQFTTQWRRVRINDYKKLVPSYAQRAISSLTEQNRRLMAEILVLHRPRCQPEMLLRLRLGKAKCYIAHWH